MDILEQRIPKLLIRLLISGAIATLYWFKVSHVPPSAVSSIVTTLASVAATLLGFIITSIALLASLLDKPLIRNMQKTGHYKCLMTEAFDTCMVLLALVVACIIGLILQGQIQEIAFAILVGFTCLALIYLLQAGRRFSNIISVLS